LTDERMDRMIGTLLRSGVIVSAAATLAGGIWHLAQSGSAMPDYHVFHGEPADLMTLSGVLSGVMAGRSECLIQLGLLMLVATPIARVALCLVAFAAERDRAYVGITLIVLTVLIASAAGLHF
jgi:uncharacterized membrane protein